MPTIIHTGDLHYSTETLVEVDRCMQRVVDAVDDSVDAVVIGGDSTDHRLDAHTPAFLALAKRVRQISDRAPLLMLQGTFSHEPRGMLNVFALINDNIFVADKIGQVALTRDKRWVVANDGYAFAEAELVALHELHGVLVLFSCLPTTNPAEVLAARGASIENAANNAEAIGEVTADVLAGWASVNAFAATLGIATVGVSHGTARESKSEHGVPMHGLDNAYSTGMLFAAGCSAFMLNHIHLHQSWEMGGRRIAYSGSLPCLHYGEEGQKGFLCWKVQPHSAEFTFYESGAQKFAHFEFADGVDFEVLKAADVSGRKVRVRVKIAEEDRASVDSDLIKAALADAEEVKVEIIAIPLHRARAEGVAAALTHAERLQLWCQATGMNESEAGRLTETLNALVADEPETIVKRLLASID